MVPGGPGSRKGGAGGDGLKATMRPLTAGSKKVLAAGAAAFFVNLHAAVTALLPTVTSDLDFLEVPIPPKTGVVEELRLDGYSKDVFCPQGPGDLLCDVRSAEGRAALQQRAAQSDPKVMWVAAKPGAQPGENPKARGQGDE